VVQVWADCAVNVEPDAETLGEIAELSAGLARRLLDEEPRVAFLSFSTAGSGSHPSLERIREGVRLARERVADGVVEGEMQLDAALVPSIAARKCGEENPVAGRANVLVFPDLNAANIAYKAAQHLGGALALGPLLRGLRGPVNDLSRGASVEDAVLITAITVIEAAGGRTADDV
jgi:phosphate acetyltransferase